jgi:hypothetical protein
MTDENPYVLPNVDETEWFRGAHLGTQIQASWLECLKCYESETSSGLRAGFLNFNFKFCPTSNLRLLTGRLSTAQHLPTFFMCFVDK